MPAAVGILPGYTGNSSSSDSMMRVLLQPPPSITVVEPSQERDPSQVGGKKSSADFFMSVPRQPPPPTKSLRKTSSCSTLLPRTSFKALVIDPNAVGQGVILEVLREVAALREELWNDAKELESERRRDQCMCDVKRHPADWSYSRISDVHLHSFLLDCEDSLLSKSTLLIINHSQTVKVHIAPLNYNNPAKIKAEEVLRYVDVEVGYGDQSRFNWRHYQQPSNRKVLMVVSHGRVVGIVVAEPIQFAYRILHETDGYMDLEEHPVPVRVGINRLWVHLSMRRRRLATVLCQLIARYFYKKETMRIEDFAFNDNSDAMVGFAKVFLNTSKPPLYCNLK